MELLAIRGGRPLEGTIRIHGAKNSALPILAATMLCGGVFRIRNCPDILDVRMALQILRYFGAETTWDAGVVTVDTRCAHPAEIPQDLMSQMRASVLFLGSALARFGSTCVYEPGGCELGKRPIDFHLSAMAQLGAVAHSDGEQWNITWENRHGGEIILPYPSVGATENAMLAAVLSGGRVEIRGAAREPEIEDLARFLRAMGAQVVGEGTEVITVAGGSLHGAEYEVMPDRIETATYLAAVAACGGDVLLREGNGAHLLPVLAALRQAGCRTDWNEAGIRLQSSGSMRGIGMVETAVYPGFPTDAQALLTAALLRADGVTTLRDSVFPARFRHIPELRRFGADIRSADGTVEVHGVARLAAADASATDLRGGAAVVITALMARGESRVFDPWHIRRGYEDMEAALRALGADVRSHALTA